MDYCKAVFIKPIKAKQKFSLNSIIIDRALYSQAEAFSETTWRLDYDA